MRQLPIPEKRVTVAFCINENILKRLNAFHEENKEYHGRKLSRSRIAEIAIRDFIEDWERDTKE